LKVDWQAVGQGPLRWAGYDRYGDPTERRISHRPERHLVLRLPLALVPINQATGALPVWPGTCCLSFGAVLVAVVTGTIIAAPPIDASSLLRLPWFAAVYALEAVEDQLLDARQPTVAASRGDGFASKR
jgi:hypothetical protein